MSLSCRVQRGSYRPKLSISQQWDLTGKNSEPERKNVPPHTNTPDPQGCPNLGLSQCMKSAGWPRADLALASEWGTHLIGAGLEEVFPAIKPSPPPPSELSQHCRSIWHLSSSRIEPNRQKDLVQPSGWGGRNQLLFKDSISFSPSALSKSSRLIVITPHFPI